MIRLDYLAVFDIGRDDFVLFRLFKLINDGVAHLVKQSFQLLLELGGIPRLHHKTALCRRKSVKRGVFVELNEIIIVKRLEIGNIHLFTRARVVSSKVSSSSSSSFSLSFTIFSSGVISSLTDARTNSRD